ncbi:hypothetical protein J2Z48_001577 [Croceifilum oryzae]|uniref:Uncharacterized protein n=1 Tax=Croceifilum oryzae TaxID=1553429 RepID=A0AAJ1TF88_9BACL|nr:hypothetical protein [Croceifilum oryzae]
MVLVDGWWVGACWLSSYWMIEGSRVYSITIQIPI